MSGKHVKDEIQNSSEVGKCTADIHTDISLFSNNRHSFFLVSPVLCQASWAEWECDPTFSVSEGETNDSTRYNR